MDWHKDKQYVKGCLDRLGYCVGMISFYIYIHTESGRGEVLLFYLAERERARERERDREGRKERRERGRED